ncbi:hypothetical protein GCM10027184_72020 [Saccharothrix stipae]
MPGVSPSTAATRSTNACSTGLVAGASPPSAVQSGAGSAARSSLPLGVNGNGPAIGTTTDGTMYSGSTPATCSRASAGDAEPTTYATSRLTRRWSSRTSTAACAMSGCAMSTLSTSPGSIRNPRIFTWPSDRPRKSMVPSARHRARSPVRYMRAPGRPNGSATNRDAVNADCPR